MVSDLATVKTCVNVALPLTHKKICTGSLRSPSLRDVDRNNITAVFVRGRRGRKWQEPADLLCWANFTKALACFSTVSIDDIHLYLLDMQASTKCFH